jgi:tetratricopeptide (TPR) repeat protein
MASTDFAPSRGAAMFRALSLSALIFVSSVAANAQQVGQRVVTSRDTKLESDDNKTRMVGEGAIVVVKKVDRDRIWIFYLDGYDSSQGWINRADVMSLSKALDFYNDAIKKNPTPTAYTTRSWILKELGDYDKAIADCGEALRLDPNSTAGFNNRGNAWTDKEEYDKAIADYTVAIRIDPKCAIQWVGRGIALMGKGEYKRAISDFDEASRLDPKHAPMYVNRGKAWHLQGQLDKAIADYSEALRLEPDDSRALSNRGRAWQDKRQLDKAITDYTDAIRRADDVTRADPHFVSIYYHRGRALFEKNDYDRAIADFCEAICLSPKDAPLSALYFYLKKDYGKAIANLEEALKREPKNTQALCATAWLYSTCPDARFRDGKKAVERATKACDLTNWEFEGYLDALGTSYAEAGDFASAIKWGTKAAELGHGRDKLSCLARVELYKLKRPYRDDGKW